jgi:hypothetical protein
MDEEDWLADRWDVSPLLVEFGTSPRKERLFCVACCRRVFDYLPGDRSRWAVTVAEEYADGGASIQQLTAAHEGVEPYESEHYGGDHNPARHASGETFSADMCALAAALLLADRMMAQAPPTAPCEWEDIDNAESLEQVRLYREVIGNPFRPIAFDPAWRTTTVVALAAGIYEERAFDRLPILSDALQDAGCDAEAILDHFRDPAAAHVRGCWALDLVLGKE